MQEYNVILTWEAIYDVTDLADNIEEEFGWERADQFQNDIRKRMESLGQLSGAFPDMPLSNWDILKRKGLI